jgi:hypothetical protein
MAAIDTLDKGGLQTLRDLYLQTRQKYVSRPDSTLIIDKLPLSTINLPVLYRLFPKSRFIFAIRHPLDCLLSCYMQNFGPNDAMSNFYNLDDAAELYVNSMGIWKKSLEYLQLRYHAVRYEDLVENLERESRALLGFLQLHWDSRVLQYHIHARKAEFINTPSYAQVTQPIYSGARYRWKNYTRQLSGTKAKVQSFIEFFGYEP